MTKREWIVSLLLSTNKYKPTKFLKMKCYFLLKQSYLDFVIFRRTLYEGYSMNKPNYAKGVGNKIYCLKFHLFKKINSNGSFHAA